MATWDDVQRIAEALPRTDKEETKSGRHKWRVEGRLFVWERPLKEDEVFDLSERTLVGQIVAIRCPSMGTRDVLVESDPGVFFVTPRIAERPTVLVLLDALSVTQLQDFVLMAWVARAPRQVAADYLRSEIHLRGRVLRDRVPQANG